MHRKDCASTGTSELTVRPAPLAWPADRRNVTAHSIADAALMIVHVAIALKTALMASIRVSLRRPFEFSSRGPQPHLLIENRASLSRYGVGAMAPSISASCRVNSGGTPAGRS